MTEIGQALLAIEWAGLGAKTGRSLYDARCHRCGSVNDLRLVGGEHGKFECRRGCPEFMRPFWVGVLREPDIGMPGELLRRLYETVTRRSRGAA